MISSNDRQISSQEVSESTQQPAEKMTCNYANNYYGDQVCVQVIRKD